jgi:hypothetical protein
MRRLLFVVLAGCTHIHGGVHAQEPSGEAWTMIPDRCFTGQKLLFNGVELESSGADPHGILVVTDPIHGPSVVVVDSSTHERVVWDAESCTQLEANVHEARAAAMNRWRAVSGSLTLACGTNERSIRGSIAFENCN